jgi:glycosidase
MSKFVVYQVLPRLFGNFQTSGKMYGTIEENGCGKFNSFSSKALEEIKSLGVTHIWYTGIIEHATQTDYSNFNIRKDHPAVVKGKAGSAYAIKDYYDVDPDLAVSVENRMKEFENLVKRTHRAGLKAIIDFVPNHVARQYYSDVKPEGVRDFGENDNTDQAFHPHNNFYYLPGQFFTPNFNISGYEEFPAKATGNDQFTASPSINDWYETVKLNYGVDYFSGKQCYFNPIPDTWLKMKDILLYWGAKKVDGFRCDMAEMIPVEFWNWVIPEVKKTYPEIIFIAEVYNPQEYRNYIYHGGFDYLYDKVGLYDLLRSVVCHNQPASSITHAWQSLHGIEENMLHFLENHDEQRIASDFFAGSPEPARPAMIVSATLSKAPVMIYAGQELGEQGMDNEGFSGLDGRTTIFDYWGVASLQHWSNHGKFDGMFLSDKQKQLRQFYKTLLHITLNEQAVSKGLMYDLEYANIPNDEFNAHRQFAFFRQWQDDLILIVVNFDSIDISTSISIPSEALDFLGIKEESVMAGIDLLDENYSEAICLSSNKKIKLKIPANSGRIIKMQPTYNFE